MEGNDKWTAIHDFWSGFGIPAYDENTVPSTAGYPRLTYETREASFNERTSLTASLWYYSTGWSDISQKASEIGEDIGEGGTLQYYDGGAVWIMRNVPFAQRMSDPEPNLRRMVLSVEVEFLS